MLVSVAGIPFYFLYWNLFRPVLMARLKYRLFKARDDLRLKLISGEIGKNEKAYEFLEKFCNKCIATADHVDLVRIIMCKIDTQTNLETQRNLEQLFDSPRPMRELFMTMVVTSFGAACANSPGVLMIVAPFIVLGVSVVWFNKVKEYTHYIVVKAVSALYLMPC